MIYVFSKTCDIELLAYTLISLHVGENRFEGYSIDAGLNDRI